MLQHVGYLCCIQALCVKLRPDYFAKKIILIAIVQMAVLGYLFIGSCNNSNVFSVYTNVAIVLMFTSYSILLYYWFYWIYQDIWLKFNSDIAVHDISILLYITISILVLSVLPFISAIMASFSVRNFNINEVLLFCYTNTAFNILIGNCYHHHHNHHCYRHHHHHSYRLSSIGSTPGRIRNYMFSLRKKKEILSKRNLLRYHHHYRHRH